jgi:hypothetical protein
MDLTFKWVECFAYTKGWEYFSITIVTARLALGITVTMFWVRVGETGMRRSQARLGTV